MYLAPAKSVHTLGMRFAIDVAFVDRDMVVLRTVTMRLLAARATDPQGVRA